MRNRYKKIGFDYIFVMATVRELRKIGFSPEQKFLEKGRDLLYEMAEVVGAPLYRQKTRLVKAIVERADILQREWDEKEKAMRSK